MNEYTTNWSMTQVHTGNLFINPLYQRQFRPEKVAKILREWNENLVEAPKVSRRGGKYWVFDGQHTIEALKAKKNNGNDMVIPVRVYEGMTLEDEIDAFCAQRGAATNVPPNEVLRAQYNKGEADVVRMVDVARQHGLIIAFNQTSGKNRCIALSKLYKVFKLSTPSQYEELLDVIKEAYDGDRDALCGKFIGGLSLFIRTYWGQYKRQMLIRKLQKHSPIRIIQEASISKSGDKAIGRVITEIYNSGTVEGKGRLEDKL